MDFSGNDWAMGFFGTYHFHGIGHRFGPMAVVNLYSLNRK